MKLIVCGDVAFKGNTFFKAVRELLKDDSGMFKGTAEGDEILSAFEEYLDNEYRPSEIWNMTEEEKEIKIEDFIDEIFSWLCDDYQEVELKED